MLQTIKNQYLTVQIAHLGAELMSIKDKDGREYLWQGDAKYWKGRAYNLFPIVGRLFGGEYTYKGKTYRMDLHGFMRKSTLECTHNDGESVIFCLKSSDDTRSQYPFDFIAYVKYMLKGNRLTTEYSIENTGSDTLIYTFGGHPGFNVPFGGDNASFEDYYLQFENAGNMQQIMFSETCFLTGDKIPYKLADGNKLHLKHSLFDNDALVFVNSGGVVKLGTKLSGRSITVEYPDMPYVGIWHTVKADAPFVCIEPWCSLPSYDNVIDDFHTKPDMDKLSAGQSASVQFSITIQE